MNEEEARSLIQEAYSLGRKLINQWHESRMAQIRLETANLSRLEERKQAYLEARNNQ